MRDSDVQKHFLSHTPWGMCNACQKFSLIALSNTRTTLERNFRELTALASNGMRLEVLLPSERKHSVWTSNWRIYPRFIGFLPTMWISEENTRQQELGIIQDKYFWS